MNQIFAQSFHLDAVVRAVELAAHGSDPRRLVLFVGRDGITLRPTLRCAKPCPKYMHV